MITSEVDVEIMQSVLRNFCFISGFNPRCRTSSRIYKMNKKQQKYTISFKPKQETKKLLQGLKDRASYVVSRRFGLEDGVRHTLESIGREYDITRERVRQIENYAISAIRKSENFEEARNIFDELKTVITDLGGVVNESELLDHLADDTTQQNHVHLYLTLGDEFTKHKEDSHFGTRWSIDDRIAEDVHQILRDVHKGLSHDDLLSEKEIVSRILSHSAIQNINEQHHTHDAASRWLRISKALGMNKLGFWGRATSPNVRTRGVRDYAYLVMRRHGSPMHFREVAESITKTFGKNTHVATTHNELIKDDRFVLVGRGVYALKEWGYKAGIVREVIRDIINLEGPLGKDEIVERVLKERYLKRNTILVNLQNPKYFKKDESGLYYIA
ncbi:MAG: hypothetical protein ACI83D_000208 [Planctomycetota bacterium]|jgi:hypothetical protein